MTATTDTRSTKIRRRVSCTLVAAAIIAAVGISTAPDASAVGHNVPTPPIRVYPTTLIL